ncbi:tRNA (adenosine(37)-N6)-threonylcarbamoyltransferase complex transferase subunit TsaD [Ruminiclostridium cellulolyticum]|uniref:tRNA N6-adenosine threonylcarbamoyltransferase n=1 Tax=Ruminiclostridium cellulolyticum (strain ATCC 35319 / DSM 5812 / JCM 6584 / H10) TaxID=394503 RepID=B8I8F9_RUMCH|nr:tRNA (adenosine(37)-N6)-threonylcarbamoyltransferase complex transferase subunit TsaD [Ruminiclostridium cellulolyticum]ACL75192.1 metalloendopeptidase, glycoprotease family [Ruminiclostridium cellulolyticum H10]
MDTLILGIESSCDETAASVVKNGRYIMSNVISSQIDLHKKYGGVVPEIASRKHVELIMPVVHQALEEAGVSLKEIDAVGVTYGPGLVGALLVGLTAAKAIAFAADKPLVGVHHIEGHIAANYLQEPELEPPFICLVASGGHSHIVHVKSYSEFEILGQTRDDAAGEAFDKISRAIGLGYPGGPLIDKNALTGNSKAIQFPRVTFDDGSLDFSFSGLKTAVLNYLNRMEQTGEKINIPDVAASFQQAVVDVLVRNTIAAANMKNIDKIALAGGVAANTQLRNDMKVTAEKQGIKVMYPGLTLCTDNAAMISCAAYYEYKSGKRAGMDLNAVPGLKLSTGISKD